MKIIIASVVVVLMCLGIYAIFPSIKGPINRVKNNVNENLNAEYCVDNYKAKFVEMHNQLDEVEKNISKFRCEEKVIARKIHFAKIGLEAYRTRLFAAKDDLKEFNRIKGLYESQKQQTEAYIKMQNVYSNAVVKLELTKTTLVDNMSKAKSAIEILESKKLLADTMGNVADTVGILSRSEVTDITVNLEKIDDDLLRSEIKLETINESSAKSNSTDLTNPNDIEAYLKSL